MSEINSKSNSELHLQLNDIIKIDSPMNENFHEKTFLIHYIDQSKIKLINIETNTTELLIVNNKILQDKTIEKIYLISRDENNSYALQNNLVVNTWITIYFSGNLPFTVTGQIVNLEEDMIEIKLYPTSEIIYIDFAYKGVPEHLNIDKIVIREKPEEIKAQEEEKTLDELNESSSGQINDNVIEDTLISDQQGPEENTRQKLIDELLDANEIEIGNELPEVEQAVQIEESKKVFGIDLQTSDLLDELLSEIPTSERNSKVMNKVHVLIERYVQLRNKFSDFDELGNARLPKIKTANYKPLVENLKSFKKDLFWIKPVVRNFKNVYDISNSEYTDDLVNNNLNEELNSFLEIFNKLKEKKETDFTKKYENYLYAINEFTRPFQKTNDDTYILHNTKVDSDIDCIVDNLDDLFSSSIKKDNVINRKRFLMHRYNTSTTDNFKDELSLKSLIILPLEYCFHSTSLLPGSNILNKSNLNKKNMFYYEIFNNNDKKHKFNSVLVSENKETDLLRNFFNNITEFNYDFSVNDKNNYDNYLQNLIPKTRVIFEKIKKYINGKQSIYNVLSYLEPFLIYNEDLTYMQYKEIASFISEKNKEYLKTYLTNQEIFKRLNPINQKQDDSKNINILYELLRKENHPIESEKNLHDIINHVYDISNNTFTSSELLSHYYDYDSTDLHNICVTLSSIHLLDVIDIQKEIQGKNDVYMNQIDEEKKNNSCGKFFLSKKYIELDELEDDNNKEIFFDKKYDSNERKVQDGDYAVLKVEDELEVYYQRKDNKWQVDSNIKGVESEQAIFCNIQDKCFQIKRDCNDLSLSESELKHKTIENILKEFDNKYEISIQELTKYLMTQLNYYSAISQKRQTIANNFIYKNDNKQINLGLKIDDEELNQPTSPYFKLRDKILSLTDFVRKQYCIIKFAKLYTRDNVSDESPFWLYCKETNLKLLPSFYLQLATCFVENKDYLYELNKICNERGKLSDDGDAYVDKYSGKTIKLRQTSDDEGYDNGFKVISKELMEQDQNVIQEENPKLYDDDLSKKIVNVVNSMSNFLAVNLNHQYEFIVRNVNNNFDKKMPSRKLYEEKANKLPSEKRKKLQSYDDMSNFFILVNTLAYIHLAIQVSIPPIKTKKSFPGKCIKSFDGYPLQSQGDYDGIKYIVCVANSIKKKIEPWNTIQKMTEEVLIEKIKNIIEKDISTNPILKELLIEKNRYLDLKGISIIPDEISVSRWQTFLPPISKVNVTQHQAVSTSFINSLLDNIKKGSEEQHEKINILRSKMMYFSNGIINEIDNIVQKQTPILTNNVKEPFLINACCIQTNNNPILDYFIERSRLIKNYNEKVIDYHNIVLDFIEIPMAPFYLHDNSTKLKYPVVSNEFEEETIYKAFIKYCRFSDLLPVPKDLQPICTSKPSSYDKNESLKVNINHLKSEGKIYSSESLGELLKIVGMRSNNKNKLHSSYFDNVHSNISKIQSFLSNIENDPIINDDFKQLILDSLDTFELVDSNNDSTIKEINDTVYEKNTSLIDEISEYLKQNSKDSPSESIKFITTYLDWKEVSYKNNITSSFDDNSYRKIEFIKHLCKTTAHIIPNMILNNVDTYNIVPRHWNLADEDNDKIRDFMNHYFNSFSRFYHSDINELLAQLNKKCENILIFQYLLPCYSDVIIDDKTYKSVLNCKTCVLLHNFCFLNILKQIILLSDEEYSQKVSETLIRTREDEDENNEYREEILLGIKNQKKQEFSLLINTCINIFIEHKNILDISYENIMSTVNKSKEKEKKKITKTFNEMKDDARKVNYKKKNLKLDEWGLGDQKGLVTYVKGFKDSGEQSDFMDLVDPTFIINENENIENEENIYQNMEDVENNSLAHLADDDDYGENDGDEGF